MTPAELDAALVLLRERVAATSIAAAARDLDYSRSAVSMVLAGTYLGSPEHLARRVLQRFAGTVECPHLSAPISGQSCADHRTRPMPTGSARSFRHWQACRTCAFNPDTGGVNVK